MGEDVIAITAMFFNAEAAEGKLKSWVNNSFHKSGFFEHEVHKGSQS